MSDELSKLSVQENYNKSVVTIVSVISRKKLRTKPRRNMKV